MNLNIGIESETKGEWTSIHKLQFIQTNNFELGTLVIPDQEFELSNGETINFYSIYVEETKGLVLEAEQNDMRLILLTCFESFDVVVTTREGCGVRFYTSA